MLEPVQRGKFGESPSYVVTHPIAATCGGQLDLLERSVKAWTERCASVEAEAVLLSGQTRYADDETPLQREGSVPLTETLPIPQPELKAFTKKENFDPVLPASKWAREDNDCDDERKRSSQGLGLSYSSSGSENAGDGPSKTDELEFGSKLNIPVLSESAMNEEKRKNIKREERDAGMICMTLQESGIGVKAKVSALQENHQTGSDRGGEIGSETDGKRVEAEKGMIMTEIEVERE
ncbi:hypothetical protein F3Y22_tig00001728pilonHSYRG00114 [Hibiscus syriacus]|uniref:Uncharacterized protein n=1 Tax=Hibiscus syriacus TaxID=106335 RepID=A0A6A3D0F0_HIBSY|nr:hypothetical protein F3Y22_tig00001728pilonHSYRG00114 [Hibiscus syriacus]